MRKQYDDFTQLKVKDMSKCISDLTYKYIHPETNTPTKVPPMHYEKILNQVTEKYMADVTSKQFLNIMYTQLVNLKKEDENYFNQALVCIDMGINPKDLRIDEQIAVKVIGEYIEDKKTVEKKNFHMLSDDIVNNFNEAKNDPELQSSIIRESNRIEGIDIKRDYRDER